MADDKSKATEKANHLLRLALDQAAKERGSREAANAALALVETMKTHGLVPSDPNAQPGLGAMPPIVINQQVIHQGEDPFDISMELLKALPSPTKGVPDGICSMLLMPMLELAYAIEGRSPMPKHRGGGRQEMFQSAIDTLVARLQVALKPTALHDREMSLSNDLDALFKLEHEQPGAAQIAKKLGYRAADVRKRLASAIESGWIEAVGTTRDRRYRWVPPEARPEFEG